MRLSLSLALLIVCAAAWPAERLLVDPCTDTVSWSSNNGGEFPGATATVSTGQDPERGTCVRGDFVFGADSRYSGVQWHGRLERADMIGFWARSTDRGWAMVRVRDATEQEHMGGASITAGKWSHVQIALKPESFGAHWGGANDGKLHYPLQTILIAVSRGPDTGELLVSNLYAELDSVTPDDRWQVVFAPQAPSGIALVGEQTGCAVHLRNRLEREANCTLTITKQRFGAEPETLLQEAVTVPGWGQTERTLDLPADEPGYWRLRAELSMPDAQTQTISGLTVVPRPRHYGLPAPDCYFGMQHIRDMEAAERLGAKAVRDAPGWRWAEPWEDHVKWEEYLDPSIRSLREHNMAILWTAQAIAPDWIAWKHPDNPKLASLPDPARLDEWSRFVRQVAERYRGQIAAIEIQNEPDLTCSWQVGLSTEDGADYYAKLLRAGAEGAKAGDPDVLIAGVDVSGGDFDGGLRFTREVLRRAGDVVDVYTGHPYSGTRYFGPGLHPVWPIENRMPEKCRAALDMMGEFGRPRRMWIGELGWGLQDTADPLSGYSLDYAACLAQSMIAGKSVPGVEKYLHFTQIGCNEGGNEYGLLRGHPAYPLPAATAYAAAAYLLDGGKPAGLDKLGADLWRARFVNEERDELIIAWWCDGEPVKLRPPVNAPDGTWTDSFFQGLRPGDGITVGRMPVYWVLPLGAEGAEPGFLQDLRVQARFPVRVQSVSVSSVDSLMIWLYPRVEEPTPVTIRFQGREQKGTVSGTGPFPFILPIDPPLQPGVAQDLRVEFRAGEATEVRTLQVSPAALPAPPTGLSVDGRLDDWPQAPQFALTEKMHVLPPDPGIGWEGPRDLSIDAWLGGDDASLSIALAVTDDVHVPPAADPNGFWNSDSIQLAMDAKNDSVNGFDEGDVELGFALTKDGPRAFITYPSRGVTEGLDLAVTRDGQRTVYEARIPWGLLGATRVKPGRIVSLNFIANDDDGQGRNYWMGLTPGIGEGKAPQSYRRFVVVGK